MRPSDTHGTLSSLEQLNQIGIALSRERDLPTLLETILTAAKGLLHADGGTLYRIDEQSQTLRFEVVRTDSLNLRLGGRTGAPITFPPIPLYDEKGEPVTGMVVTHAVLHDTTVVIDDAYTEQNFDFSRMRQFDEKNGYRSQSFLTVPMKDYEGRMIGAFQLINAIDPDTGAVCAFSQADRQLAESLASQAAIALTNNALITQLRLLFEGLITMINTAIDRKSPYTGAHCERVPELTMMIAETARHSDRGRLKDFRPTEEELYELKIAGLLHDCGKIATPVHVMDKSTKLETIFDRIHLVDARFEVLKRDVEIAYLKANLEMIERGDAVHLPELAQHFSEQLQAIESDRAHVRHCNKGGEFMSPEAQERIRRIAARRWIGPDGQECAFLSAEEVMNLCIPRGTLTPEERVIIEQHVALTLEMLEKLPWPSNLRNVPEYAASHHEKLDGHGYHRHLSNGQLSTQARIIGLADVFEALSARDRPYKHGKPLSQVLAILGQMVQDRHIDSDLFDIFVRNGVWLEYAKSHLEPEQIDEVDLSRIPGYTP